MNPKEHPEDSQSNQKEKTLPTYVFGEDYKQTVNLPGEDKTLRETGLTQTEESQSDKTDAIPKEQDKILSESVSIELEKLDSEKIRPISMIVNKKKFRIRFLVVLLFLSAVSFGSLYGISFLLKQGIIGNGKNKHSAAGLSMESLICEVSGKSGDLLGIGNALDAKSTARVNYINDEFSDITQVFEARFDNYATAKIALTKARSEYVKRFKSAGIATEPFKSDYTQNDATIVVTHQADSTNIDKKNAAVMYIEVNKNGVVIYDIDSIKKNYEKLGYTCSIE